MANFLGNPVRQKPGPKPGPNSRHKPAAKKTQDIKLAKAEDHYKTLAEAKFAAQRLGMKSESDYKSYRSLDRRLPPGLPKKYASEWKSWEEFFGLR